MLLLYQTKLYSYSASVRPLEQETNLSSAGTPAAQAPFPRFGSRCMRLEQLETLTAEYGYPLYVYEEKAMAAQLAALQAALPGFTLLYSVKTNPHPAVCAFMRRSGVGADAASAAEVDKAERAGMVPGQILYSAPGKRESEIAHSLGRCVLVADSYTELALIQRICQARGTRVSVGLRLNPDLSFGPGTAPALLPGAPAKFGVDAESLASRRDFLTSLSHVRVCGIHIYLRSQVLNHAVLAAYMEHVLGLSRFWKTELGLDLDFINFGGGFGVPYTASDRPIDWAAFASRFAALFADGGVTTPDRVRFFAESGRYLVSAAGTFVTRITDVKESRGTRFVLAPGPLNNFLRPAVMNLLDSLPHPVSGPLEPLYSGPGAFPVYIPGREGEEEEGVSVSGTLCTALDRLAVNVRLPRPRVGDILCVRNAGAYACTLSPHEFAGLGRPKELFLAADGSVSVFPEEGKGQV